MSSAALALDHAHTMIRQMAMPLISERRVKGALQVVSRETGVSYSKTRKIFYRLTDNILHFEFANITEAFKRSVIKQEQQYRMKADELAALSAEIERLGEQYEMDLALASRMAPQQETSPRNQSQARET